MRTQTKVYTLAITLDITCVNTTKFCIHTIHVNLQYTSTYTYDNVYNMW
jgi:hypothetical protein